MDQMMKPLSKSQQEHQKVLMINQQLMEINRQLFELIKVKTLPQNTGPQTAERSFVHLLPTDNHP